jgi:hypothetical protein
MGGICRMHRRYEIYIQKFVGKPERKRALGRTRHRWKILLERILGK